jgi:hypothetical protein
MNKPYLLAILLLTGCASNDTAVFVTSTSLSIFEGDSKPAGVSIGYKRVEGYLGPNNADGSAPPVLASIETDANIWSPKVRQLYATGDAAVIAATGKNDKKATDTQAGLGKVMFFGTSTNLGLSIGTTANVPDSFAFGYKRKEMSVIPLVKISGSGNSATYSYPSVLASIDTAGSAGREGDGTKAALSASQFFATGDSARAMAAKLSSEFVDRAEMSVGAAQKVMAGRALTCYARVMLQDRAKVWEDAHEHDLYNEHGDEKGKMLTHLQGEFALSVENNVITDADRLYRADAVYAKSVFIVDDRDTGRLARVAEHRGFVCALARSNKK